MVDLKREIHIKIRIPKFIKLAFLSYLITSFYTSVSLAIWNAMVSDSTYHIIPLNSETIVKYAHEALGYIVTIPFILFMIPKNAGVAAIGYVIIFGLFICAFLPVYLISLILFRKPLVKVGIHALYFFVSLIIFEYFSLNPGSGTRTDSSNSFIIAVIPIFVLVMISMYALQIIRSLKNIKIRITLYIIAAILFVILPIVNSIRTNQGEFIKHQNQLRFKESVEKQNIKATEQIPEYLPEGVVKKSVNLHGLDDNSETTFECVKDVPSDALIPYNFAISIFQTPLNKSYITNFEDYKKSRGLYGTKEIDLPTTKGGTVKGLLDSRSTGTPIIIAYTDLFEYKMTVTIPSKGSNCMKDVDSEFLQVVKSLKLQ